MNKRDHIQGPVEAAVELVEYGDYECPQCQAAHPVVKLIQAEFGDDLCFAYRHFPLLDIHPLAMPAAEAAEAAGAQGRFWQMHELLFQNSPDLDPANLIEIASGLGLDIERFDEDLVKQHHVRRIRDDIESGKMSGAHGTPTFFINGMKYEGGFDWESLLPALQAVDRLMAR